MHSTHVFPKGQANTILNTSSCTVSALAADMLTMGEASWSHLYNKEAGAGRVHGTAEVYAAEGSRQPDTQAGRH